MLGTAQTTSCLLDDFEPGAFYLGTPQGVLLAQGVYFAVPPSMRDDSLADLPARASAVLGLAEAAGIDSPVIVGAIPFDPRADARLIVPRTFRRTPAFGGDPHPSPRRGSASLFGGDPHPSPRHESASLNTPRDADHEWRERAAAFGATGHGAIASPTATHHAATLSAFGGDPHPTACPHHHHRDTPGDVDHRLADSAIMTPCTTQRAIMAVPPERAYVDAVGRAVARLRSGDLDKVVLARALHVMQDKPFEVKALLEKLARRNPGGHIFAADLGQERTLLGASPELLVSRFGRTVVTHPLAGSAPRDTDPSRLLASKKDRYEHSLVVEAIEATLRPLCSEVDVPREPSLVATPTMWHLGTRITATVKDPAVSALALAAALHPTPAVCGSPTGVAREAIAEFEPMDRGFYTGMVGWGDVHGDGEWAVTIRCAVVEGSGMTLYAGAGIVADSDPSAELDETSAKFGTLLEVLS